MKGCNHSGRASTVPALPTVSVSFDGSRQHQYLLCTCILSRLELFDENALAPSKHVYKHEFV